MVWEETYIQRFSRLDSALVSVFLSHTLAESQVLEVCHLEAIQYLSGQFPLIYLVLVLALVIRLRQSLPYHYHWVFTGDLSG